MNTFIKGLAVTAFATAVSGCGGATPTVLCESADNDQVTIQTVGGKYSKLVIKSAEGAIFYEAQAVHGEATLRLKEKATKFCQTGETPAP